jgi:uncharacterized protein (DUF1800 family)
MAASREEELQHLLRRAGFGASQADVEQYARRGLLAFSSAAAHLLTYQEQPDDVDAAIQTPGYVNVTPSQGRGGAFVPASFINDARQRWLFRMVHSTRPLQEKMTLFWHNHFATAYSKIAGEAGATEAARMMAAKPSEDPGSAKGQLELLREHALGNFRDLLVAIAQDPAMLYWLDGRSNVRARPQENFARELMELFTMGVGTFQETDVYAGARVFTGWNLARPTNAYYAFSYNAGQHDTDAKEFSFPVYQNGSRTIPARSAAQGMQDGLDFIDGVVRHPATGPRLALKLYNYFMNETDAPDAALLQDMSRIYYDSGFEIKPMLFRLLISAQFHDERNWYKRYSWPVEFVSRSLKEVGWNGFSLANALTPLLNMGQQLFEPPDVNGWDLGRGWFSSGGMLSRMNFAAQLASNQKFNLRDLARPVAKTPEALLSFVLDRLTPNDFATTSYNALLDYARAGITWSGSDDQIATKAAGLVHLVVGSGDYQLV